MKTRTGFVSNSSTSSFVIVGFALPIPQAGELQQMVSKLGHDWDNYKIRPLVLDRNDKNGMQKTRGNEDAFELVTGLRYTSGKNNTICRSIRLGLPAYGGDGGYTGIEDGMMVVGVEESDTEISLRTALPEVEKIREILGLPSDKDIIVVGSEGEQGT